MLVSSATAISCSATSGQIASSLPAACGAEAVTYIRSDKRKEIQLPPQQVATVGWRKGKSPFRKLSGLQTREGGNAVEDIVEDKQDCTGRLFSKNLNSLSKSFAAELRGKTEEQQ
jgi:hypothetical protein